MRGLVIFDDHTEVVYFHVDKELEKFVKERRRTLEISAGATDRDVDAASEDLRTILQMFLLPFYTASTVLANFKKPIYSISLEEDFLIVFRKFGENVFIAISSGHGDTEESLSKKMTVFSQIISFILGPVHHRICPMAVSERRRMWKFLSKLLTTYEKLYSEDQVFLLEAVEHVTFGQLQAAQEVVVKVVRESLDQSNNGGLPNVQHAMLLVQSKLLAICGRSPQILTSDILLMILFVSCFFHNDEEEEEEEEEMGEEINEQDITYEVSQTTASEEQTFPEELDPQSSLQDLQDVSGQVEVFQTPTSTPRPVGGLRGEDPFYEAEDPPFATPGPELQFTTPVEDVDGLASMRESSLPNKSIPNRIRHLFGGLKSKSGKAEVFDEEPMEKDVKFMEQLVFLQPHAGHFIPHRLHCLEVYPGIVLVLISEYRMGNLAGTICQTLHHLESIFVAHTSGGQSVFDLLEEAFRRINSLVRHEVQVTASNVLKQSNLKVQNSWSNLKSAGFRRYLDRGEDSAQHLAHLEASSRDLTKKVLGLFEQFFFTPKQCEYDTAHVRSKLIRNFSCFKRDYGEFLAMKGTMNIPMVSFSVCHPGMVHFILIDRSFDEMTAPSIPFQQSVGLPYVEKIAAEKGVKSGEFLKKKIWEMVKRSQKYLSQGYPSQTWVDQHFLYSYYMWLNLPNSAHGPMRFIPQLSFRVSDVIPPGVIGTQFYRELAQCYDNYQGYVYELYCIHEAAVPIRTAAVQCRELANQLWPNSKEAIAPFTLIN